MTGWGWFFLILFLVLLAYAGWAGWHFYHSKRQGLPPPPLKSYIPFYGSRTSNTNYPTPRSSGPLEWIKDQLVKLRNKRTARGAYEEAGGSAEQGYAGLNSRGRSGRTGGGLEDDAWDTRVGNEDPYGGAAGGSGHGGYYEEQELGLHSTPGYANESYGGGSGRSDYKNQSTSYGGSDDRGRSKGNNLDDPFSDQHQAPSLRSVSPRPAAEASETAKGHKSKKDNASLDSTGSSPSSVRKSAFREGI